jgi:hypothetical protein
MAELHRQFEEAGGTTALHSRVVGGSVANPVKELMVQDVQSGQEVQLAARWVVNTAGLHAQVGGGICPSALRHPVLLLTPKVLAGSTGWHTASAAELLFLLPCLVQAVAASLQGMPAAIIPPLYLAKGSYFTLVPGALASMLPAPSTSHSSDSTSSSSSSSSKSRQRSFQHLIYPMPEPGTAGLGCARF